VAGKDGCDGSSDSPSRRFIERRASGYRVGLVMRRAVLAIALGATAVVAGVIGPALALIVVDQIVVDLLIIALAVLAMASVGVILAIRVPANAVGWLLIVAALAFGVEFLAVAYWQLSIKVAGRSWPGTVLAAWLYSNLLLVPVMVMVFTIPLIFPDGRLLSPRWRWLVGLLVLSMVQSLAQAFRPGLISDTNVENPFGIAALVPLLDALKAPAFGILAVPLFIGPIASVVIRFRRGIPAERAQLKWLIAATTAAVFAWSVVAVGEATGSAVLRTAGWYGGLLAFVGLPLAVGIAVLRYRLYEIDRIISRTIAWALVTGVLVSVFAAGVVALQAALIGFTQGQTLAVAVSTLGAAALFQPLRRRVQRVVDRRFDRASTTPSGRSRPSRCGCVTRWRWTRSRPIWSKQSRTRSSQ
jgi:hypothetical protein